MNQSKQIITDDGIVSILLTKFILNMTSFMCFIIYMQPCYILINVEFD